MEYEQRRRAALMITPESLADFRERIYNSKHHISETDQVLTPEQIVQPLDLSGIQQDGDAVDDDRHIQLARSGTQLDYMDNDHTPATPPLPPVSPRTPGRQRSPLYRMLNFSPRSPRFTFAASLASISPRRSGAPEKSFSPFRVHSPNDSMLEHLQLSFTADESFPVTRFDESAYCDEMTEDVPLDVSGGDEQLCSLLSKLRIASDVSPMVEDRKQKAKVLTPTGKQATTTIEPFYHPGGKPVSSEDNKNALRKAYQIFTWCGNKITFTKMVDICDAMGIPRYWKRPIFNNCVRNPNEDTITVDSFVDFWGRMTAVAHDDAARFVFALTNGTRDYVEYSDFASLIMDVVETHPSLDFLKSDSRFHNAYVETVTCRIFWNVNRSWSGRIKAAELRRSNFLDVLRDLNTKDVNDLLDYFSYEHFYVVYCKFQELADGRDCITPEELANYERGVLPDIVVTRIFTGAVSRGAHSEENLKQQKAMTYKEFVYFLMAEVDKSNPTSIEYWFRVLDLNGDGRLSMDELQQFFDGIIAKMNAANIDAMSFTDVICLLWDAVRPCCEAYITLSDIKRSQVSTYFLNTFINWLKYFLQETCEGSDRIEGKQHEMSEWNTYCEKEHDVLMAENEDGEEFDENFNDSALEAHDVALSCATFLTDSDVPSSR